jgi:hypothetical protein
LQEFLFAIRSGYSMFKVLCTVLFGELRVTTTYSISEQSYYMFASNIRDFFTTESPLQYHFFRAESPLQYYSTIFLQRVVHYSTIFLQRRVLYSTIFALRSLSDDSNYGVFHKVVF